MYTQEEILEWSKRETLREGDFDNPDVVILQNLLNKFMDDELSRPLTTDGDYGGMTSNAVYLYQQYRLLGQDGTAGQMETKPDMYKAFVSKWTDKDKFEIETDQGSFKVYGKEITAGKYDIMIPKSQGEVSFYGGPNDPGDYWYGQAYVSDYLTSTPKEYCTKNKELVTTGILREECLDIDEYPIKGGRRCGASWCLDPVNGWYSAVYTAKSYGLYGAKNPKIVVINKETGDVGVYQRTDQGPRPDCGAVDLPYNAEDENTMNFKQDDIAIIGWADWDVPLGYKGKIKR